MMLTLIRREPCERMGEPVEIDGVEYQVWSDPAVMGLDRYYITRDGQTVERRLMREEAANYLWLQQWTAGVLESELQEQPQG